LSAGANTVFATLWEVNDRTTAQLMRSFYRNVSENSPSLSLAAAQRSMLHGDSAHRHPYYWSAFVLVGSGQALIPASLTEKR